MEKLIQVKTPLGLQTYFWRNGALARIDGEFAGTVELSEELKMWLIKSLVIGRNVSFMALLQN